MNWSSLRERVTAAGATVLLAMALGGCATTVAGKALAGPSTGGGQSPPVVQSTDKTEQTDDTEQTDTAQTDDTSASTQESTPESTAESTPKSSPESTRATTVAPPISSPSRTSAATGGKGVPAPRSSTLRKNIGQQAGITDEAGTPTFTFAVTAIDPDFLAKCNGTKAKKNNFLIGVKVVYEVLPEYAADQGAVELTPKWFSVRTADGKEYNELGTAQATACQQSGAVPNRALKVGDKGSGWVVLDSPVRYGALALTQEKLDGNWEWIIPGS